MIPQFDIPSSDDAFRRKRLKVPSACAECRRRKTKCDGRQPCASCIKAKVECRYVVSKNTLKNTSNNNNSSSTTTFAPSPMIKQEPQPESHHHSTSLATPTPGLPNLGSMRSSFSSTITPRPLHSASLTRHSFSHYVPQPTPPHSGSSSTQEEHYLHRQHFQLQQQEQGQRQQKQQEQGYQEEHEDELDSVGSVDYEGNDDQKTPLHRHLKERQQQQQSGKQRQIQLEQHLKRQTQHQQHLKQQQLQNREQARLNVPTIVAIEERLAAIERILHLLLEKSEMAKPSQTDLDNERWTHRMNERADHYLTPTRTTTSNNSDSESNGTPSTTHEYLRLPPLYSNNNMDPSSSAFHNTAPIPTSPPRQQLSTIFTSSPVAPTSSLRSGIGRPTSTPPLATKQLAAYATRLGDAETRSSPSTPPIQPMITGFKRPHDATPGQPSPPLSSSPSSSLSSQPTTDAVQQQQQQQQQQPDSTHHHNQHSIPY